MTKRYDYYQRNYDKDKIETLNNYIDFCSVETNRKIDQTTRKFQYNGRRGIDNCNQISGKVRYINCNDNTGKKLLNHTSIKDIPLAYLKYNEFNKLKINYDVIKKCASNAGLQMKSDDISEFVFTLLPSSFIITGLFKLESPYYSADDSHYYIIDNPVLKDKVFKVPMIRGSGWKGVIASAAKKVMENAPSDKLIEYFLSFTRLFGSGSKEFRELIEIFGKIANTPVTDIDKIKQGEFRKQLKLYAVFNLGKEVKLGEEKDTTNVIWEKIKEKALQVQRGRLIFYPSFFNKLGLEMINPHKRKTKAGTNPVHYEVVPTGANGRFQLFYIPADGICKPNEKLKKEVDDDKELLSQSLKLIFEGQKSDDDNDTEFKPVKIGAKTKLGWGRVAALKAIKLIDREGNEQIVVPEVSNQRQNTGAKNESK